MQKLITLFNSGGPMMYPLVLLALVMFVIFLERFLYLHKGQIRAVEFVSGIKESLKKKRVLEAITICDESSAPVPRIIKEALINSEKSTDVMSQAVNASAINQFALLNRRITSLALIAKIAPLIGLLGTIFALLQIFSDMSSSGSYISMSELSTYIYNALVSSAFGLLISIISFIFYSFLISKIRAISHDIDWSANDIMLFIIRGMPEKEDLQIEGKK